MKKLIVYTMAMVIIALSATSCGKRTPPEQVEYFDGEEIADFSDTNYEDSPPCDCDDDVWHLYYSHTHIT